MIGSSKNNRENYQRKYFWTQERETRVKFNPGLSANRPSDNWAQKGSYISNCNLNCTLLPYNNAGKALAFPSYYQYFPVQDSKLRVKISLEVQLGVNSYAEYPSTNT